MATQPGRDGRSGFSDAAAPGRARPRAHGASAGERSHRRTGQQQSRVISVDKTPSVDSCSRPTLTAERPASNGYSISPQPPSADGGVVHDTTDLNIANGHYPAATDNRKNYPQQQVYQNLRENNTSERQQSNVFDRENSGYQKYNKVFQEDREAASFEREDSHYQQEADLLAQRGELMNSILEDEEQLIAAHRAHIEQSMEVVREEMVLLSEVDQPGSAIDRYVESMDLILGQKVAMIQEMTSRLDNFKQKLKREESLSQTISNRRGNH